jgi:predicted GNAT superfamily acetyltransferase
VAPASAGATAGIVVRVLATPEDYAACVALQRVVWGASYGTVPGALIKVSQRIGGLAAGAFDPEGGMRGFIFGLTGVEEGAVVHWSHMLAVHPAARDQGVGRLLKAYQLEAVRSLGAARIEWTFDPLVARNAHLNINVLGVDVRAYVRDMYPDTGSDLHSFGTDRLIVSLALTDVVRARPQVSAAMRSAPIVSVADGGGAGVGVESSCVRIRVPGDIEALAAADLDAARAWRTSTRAAFQLCVGAGYRVVGFHSESRATGAYVLARGG